MNLLHKAETSLYGLDAKEREILPPHHPIDRSFSIEKASQSQRLNYKIVT